MAGDHKRKKKLPQYQSILKTLRKVMRGKTELTPDLAIEIWSEQYVDKKFGIKNNGHGKSEKVKGKFWHMLTEHERYMVEQYVDSLVSKIEKLKSGKECNEYIMNLVPIAKDCTVLQSRQYKQPNARSFSISKYGVQQNTNFGQDHHFIRTFKPSSTFTSSSSSSSFSTPSSTTPKSFYNISQPTANKFLPPLSLGSAVETKTSKTLSSMVKCVEVASYGQIYSKYKDQIEKNDKKKKTTFTHCTNCEEYGWGIYYLITDKRTGDVICERCGVTYRFPLAENSGAHTYEENTNQVTIVKPTRYQREEYFKRLLDRTQAKRIYKIPPHVIDLVINGMATTRSQIATKNVVRNILKKRNLQAYYPYITGIICIINKTPSPVFTDHQIAKLMSDFREMQEPFEACPSHIKKRTSFLSYPYCGYKLCELNGYTEFLKCFSLMKEGDKIKEQDDIFEWICNNKSGTKWKFKKTDLMLNYMKD
jgi:Poxvirus Late Transcription Factor VLTF3 like.